jgi:predicted secreted protein
MRKRIGLIAVACILGLYPLMAGDISTFVNLGFSTDSRYFMFGQYGVDEESAKPYADIFLVDVIANKFVDDGVRSEIFDSPVSPGYDALGAIFTLLYDSRFLKETYQIDHLSTGRLVYLYVNGKEPKSRLEFRDFKKGYAYVVSLVQKQFGTDAEESSSFHINLSVTDTTGSTKVYTVGLPNYRRIGVLNYRIKQVIFSSDERSLVFVIEKEQQTDQGINVRYMVETIMIR